MLIIMMRSVSSSHFSTAPRASAGFRVLTQPTFSPSALTMPWTMVFSSKSREWIASKHFLRCGCTRSGSFVSERISSNSSLDRKKKRGKYRRLVSRYSFKPLLISSSIARLSFSFSSNPARRVTTSTAGLATVIFIVSLNVRSTWSKRSASAGICFLMSSLLKMGSRYSHCACTLSQMSMTSWVTRRNFSQSLARTSKGLMNGDAIMVWVLTMWSSSSISISSTQFPLRMCVPLSRYGGVSNFMGSHSEYILSRVFSRLHSLLALSLISDRFSSHCDTFLRTYSPRQDVSVGLRLNPTAFWKPSQ
mmetsp:Transcript_13745/g.31865  ORF Transcript_13745/g.31865 Transcript_13745/m.31865 type:complete len:305 (-) Transcript_13745:1763-2677(-)